MTTKEKCPRCGISVPFPNGVPEDAKPDELLCNSCENIMNPSTVYLEAPTFEKPVVMPGRLTDLKIYPDRLRMELNWRGEDAMRALEPVPSLSDLLDFLRDHLNEAGKPNEDTHAWRVVPVEFKDREQESLFLRTSPEGDPLFWFEHAEGEVYEETDWVEILRENGFIDFPIYPNSAADGTLTWEIARHECAKEAKAKLHEALRDLTEYDGVGETLEHVAEFFEQHAKEDPCLAVASDLRRIRLVTVSE